MVTVDPYMGDHLGERVNGEEVTMLAGEAAVVIDPRLADLWQLVWSRTREPDEPDTVSLGTLAALLRLAYAQGYADAHSEEISGSLFLELGLRTPTTAPRRSGRRSRRGRAAPGSSDR